MNEVYDKIANAAVSLEAAMNLDRAIVRLGVDGFVAGDFLKCAAERRGAYFPAFDMTVQVSSKDDNDDTERLWAALKAGSLLGKTVYGVDLRTKTGSLGKKLKDYVEEIESVIPKAKVDFKYAVFFDPELKADIRGSIEELKDEERPRWYDGPYNSPIKFVNRRWKYQTTNSDIEKLMHVAEIRNLIPELVLNSPKML